MPNILMGNLVGKVLLSPSQVAIFWHNFYGPKCHRPALSLQGKGSGANLAQFVAEQQDLSQRLVGSMLVRSNEEALIMALGRQALNKRRAAQARRGPRVLSSCFPLRLMLSVLCSFNSCEWMSSEDEDSHI